MGDLQDPDEVLAGIRSDWPLPKAVNLTLISMYRKRIGRFSLVPDGLATLVSDPADAFLARVEFDYARIRSRLEEMAGGPVGGNAADGVRKGLFGIVVAHRPTWIEFEVAHDCDRIDVTLFVPLGEHL
jgi:hypothetical protein